MKYFTFYRESNKFADILTDPVLKKLVKTKVTWNRYLIIGIVKYENESAFSYITLKYGDDMKSDVVTNRSPIPNVDYVPKR
jgi:hypothetical protein